MSRYTSLPVVTQFRLKELLSYDPETGIFAWRRNMKGGARAGSNAGSIGGPGYVMIGLDGRMYVAHRLAWLYMTGEWPSGLVDHRDRSKTNNRWANLRGATREQNMANSGHMSTNTSGVKGVSFDKRDGKWFAYIGTGGRRRSLGYFSNFEDARAARLAAEVAHQGEYRCKRPDGTRRCFFAPPPNS